MCPSSLDERQPLKALTIWTHQCVKCQRGVPRLENWTASISSTKSGSLMRSRFKSLRMGASANWTASKVLAKKSEFVMRSRFIANELWRDTSNSNTVRDTSTQKWRVTKMKVRKVAQMKVQGVGVELRAGFVENLGWSAGYTAKLKRMTR